jgi:hypothetical protein
MSEEAKAVLSQMRAGRVLVGCIADFGRPFRLERENTWDDVNVSTALELIESGSIRAVADRGGGQMEFRTVTG